MQVPASIAHKPTMTTNDTTLGAVFELQRATIERTGAAVEQTLSAPTAASEAFLLTGESGEEMRERMLDLSRRSVHQSLDTVARLQGGETDLSDLHNSVDSMFDTLDDQQEAATESVHEEYERVEAELTDALDEQFESLLDAHESLESQLVTLVETVDDLDVPDPDETETAASDAETPDEHETDTAETDDVPADEVACRVCGDTFGAITYSHLQTHDLTIAGYREEFGEDVPLRPDE